MKIRVSSAVQEDAKKVFQHNIIINQGDTFEIFEVPVSISRFEGYALILFKESHDFVAGNVPRNTMFIPIKINDRQGYFIGKDVALNYSTDIAEE